MISSPHNRHIKRLRSLMTNRKDRRHERLFVIEGVRLVEEALRSGARFALTVYNPEQLSATERGASLQALVAGLDNAYTAPAEVIEAITDTVSPQGIVAAVEWPDVEPGRSGVQLVLDAVQDPGNVGTLLRTAEATGVSHVICLTGSADVYSPKVVRAAMGAHFRLPLVQDVGWDEAPGLLVAADNVYAAVASAPMPYYAADWRQPSALLVGNEANGVSEAGLAVATKQISIPMVGPVESLNAAVAGSVILFEALRQRKLGRS